MTQYLVIDLQTEVIDPQPVTVVSYSPEGAAKVVLGAELVRGGSTRHVRARVYFQNPGEPISMVRLYTKLADRQPH